MNQEQIDLEFRARTMGAPALVQRHTGDGGLPLPQLRKWVNAAASDDAKRAAGLARLDAWLGALPTAEDFERVPAEVPPRVTRQAQQDERGRRLKMRVWGSDGAWLGDVLDSGRYEGLCPCESSVGFSLCHGAADYADRT